MLKSEMPTAITTCESPLRRQVEAHGCMKWPGNFCGFAALKKNIFLSSIIEDGLA